jgi:hypothetical protein
VFAGRPFGTRASNTVFLWQLPQTFEGVIRHNVHSVGLGLADISSGRRKVRCLMVKGAEE